MTQASVARHSTVGHASLPRQRVSYIENGLLPTAEQLRCYLRGCGQPDLFDELDAVRSQLTPSIEPLPQRAAVSGRRVAIVAAVSAVACLAVVIIVMRASSDPLGPASAAKPSSSPACAPGFVCFWSDTGFAGTKVQLDPDWATGSHCVRLPFAARSVVNNSRERQRGYANSDCTGAATVLQHLGGVEPSVDVNAYKHS
ncbi:peptidase inhibitor family I36 protein [Amycolatopsis sp. OK19-0408]|uniref:Peptidase inhibitor family I36 protein n=1 Tax=Amycolatopsis iheyensis TaxID=2945988 RepID=A0A9X2SKQ1_9PSEU|nr:peptidase inhibitor family I36 protein [Amycolatopsis iheyensis]MCR6484091.1 peptidase inhibitor family I36 protein [Amycolatopsis iheyensis]